MYNIAYHKEDLSKFKFLVTGGAGFIGSNIVEYLLKFNAGKVYVVDNLSTGSIENIQDYERAENFKFIKADINDTSALTEICVNVDFVLHQAALGSVPRSIVDPLSTHAANATGFLSVLEACRKGNVKRLVYASSSSVYGDSVELPKKEDLLGSPKSPYAITKLMDESYAQLYSKLHGMEIIGLRYFNIFGPRQNPKGPYAAAIPLFILSALNGERPKVFGDGEQTRDFTYVENAVQANIKSVFANSGAVKHVFNIACGNQYSLNEVLSLISEITGIEVSIEYAEMREGDILHSMASIDKASSILSYDANVQLKEGMIRAVKWYQDQLIQSSRSRPIGQ